MGSKPNWRQEELDFIEDKWGTSASIPNIAKALNRSVNAVKLKAQRLGLGSKLQAGEWVTVCQLRQALLGTQTNNGGGYYLTSWVKNRGFPVKKRRVDKNSFSVVFLDEFWEWAKRNQSFLDFSRFEPLALGEEPAWVSAKRKRDFEARCQRKTTPWTSVDDFRLRHLVATGKTYDEVSRALCRSAGAIAKRCRDIGIGYPKRIPSHAAPWTRKQYWRLRELILEGKPWVFISQAIGKSEKAVRGQSFRIWGSEGLDKLRESLIEEKHERFLELLNGRGIK